jgi:shikimate dehydrogenase
VRLVVLGDPIDHSLSPAIHSAALRSAGLPGSYEARRVDREGMRRAVAELRSGDLDGANVTMPHKALAAGFCDDLEPIARRAGVVNTLVRVGETIVGHNTDVAGIRIAADEGGLPTRAPVLILGAGGAAAAALLAFGGRELAISARRPGAGAALAESIGVPARELSWGAGLPDAVVVNATPLGMHGEGLPRGTMEGASGLLDMAYGAAATPAVTEGLSAGLPVVDGVTLLVAQAAESFRLWTGMDADRAAMRAAVAERA